MPHYGETVWQFLRITEGRMISSGWLMTFTHRRLSCLTSLGWWSRWGGDGVRVGAVGGLGGGGLWRRLTLAPTMTTCRHLGWVAFFPPWDTKKERQTGEDQQLRLPANCPGCGNMLRSQRCIRPKVASMDTWPDGTIIWKKNLATCHRVFSGPHGCVQMQKINSPGGINKAAFSFIQGNLKMGNCQVVEQSFREFCHDCMIPVGRGQIDLHV